MNRVRIALVAAVMAIVVSGIPTAASAATDSTGWITSNGRYVLAGCSVYSDWPTSHKEAWSTETVSCPGSVRAGLKIGTTYIYSTWKGYQAGIASDVAGSAHYSAYTS